MARSWEPRRGGGSLCACLLGLCLLLGLLPAGSATTHWIVTEDGKIQQQVDSPVNLKHPHDLVILMRQEATVNYLKELEKQLVAQKIHIEENEDRDTGLEQRHYKEDADCLKAKVPLGDLDLYDGTYISLESKNVSPEDYIDSKSPSPPELQKPDCTKIVALPYSIHAFQHLRGIQERINLSAPLLPKEDPIFAALSGQLGKGIDDIGHRIQESLLKNASSWVLYNMASFYWRIKNEPFHVVECAMRALHVSSRQNKDVALVNVANVLHRAHFSADAAILAHAALDVTSDFLTNHYTLGNIYAMLGEYNHSVLCYDHALQSKPGFEQAVKRKHAVLCQQKLEQKLEAQHRSLQRTLNELKEYQKQHDYYLRQQEVLEKHKLIQEEQILRNIIHETQMAKEVQLGNHQICRLGHQQHSLHCKWDLPVRYYRGDIFENVEYVQFGEDSSISGMSSVNLDLPANQSDHNDDAHSPLVLRSIMQVWGREPDTFVNRQDIMWPRRPDCAKAYPTIPSLEELPTYFLPPENRGLGGVAVESKVGNAAGESRAPDCSSITSVRQNETLHQLVKDLDNKINLKLKMPDGHARQILFSRITGIPLREEQIGELLFQALQKPSNPLWFLLNEVGLYWRAVGNSTSAITCLSRALNLAPEQYQDIPLVNLANLLMHYGLPLDASRLLLRALAINSSEPLTFLSLGNAYLALKNISGALQAFRQSLALATRCPDCESSLQLIRCLQLYPLLYNITASSCSGKKPDYRSLGWPSPDECLKLRRVELTTVASTWLAVSAKNIDITEHIDFVTQLQEPGMEPLCNANLAASMHTLDHLHGVSNRASIHYTGESQLKEVLQNLGKDKHPPQSFEQVGTRIAKVLEKNQTSWVLSSMAALYWRVKGQGKKAIDCLRQALHYAPHHMKDVPLISLANIFHNAKLWNDAIIVATMAMEIAPHFVVNHFTLANVYVAMEEFEKAMRWYESTLKLQPEFEPAKDRIRTIQCHLLLKKDRQAP
ncbi:tetratricopeptide repeat protein 17 isoform X3 [Rhinatrema bivittatum]|uniref:tetratricopeptide repeat protein 17 isoform X3 n=1 Tax=Rhinatrema bivittatum TaxID=194408 RepID=UPI00112B2E06|nr:tetratricopeptide repeat protein 17 isoform X3 [Rhinatrema bivittatum]